MVLDEEQQEEHYNPVMWCVPSSGFTHIRRWPHLLLYSPVMWWVSSARVFTFANDSSYATKPSHVVQPSAPVVQAAFSLCHAVETNAVLQVLKHGAVLFPHEYIATPQRSFLPT